MAGRNIGAYRQTVRVLRLRDRLTGRPAGVPLRRLASELGVSERQVRRDLAALEEAGHAIAFDLDDGRSLVRLRDPTLRNLALSRRELYTLLSIRRVFDILGNTPFHEDVESIFEKLTALLPTDTRRAITALDTRFIYVPDGGVKPYAGKTEILDALQDGVLNRRLVRYRYRAATGKQHEGQLAAYAIILYRNGLYVLGRKSCTDDDATTEPRPPRLFAAERFLEAEALKRTRFEVPPDLDITTHFEGAFGIFTGGTPQQVTIDFTKSIRPIVEARIWHPTQKLTPLARGRIRLTLSVTNTTELVPWLLAFGPHARVRTPGELSKLVAEEHRSAARGYRYTHDAREGGLAKRATHQGGG